VAAASRRVSAVGSVITAARRRGGPPLSLVAVVSTVLFLVSIPVGIALTDHVLPLTAVFGPDGHRLAAEVRAEADTPFAVMETFLRARRPPPDPHLDVIADIVRTMLEDPAVVRVDDLAARHAMSPRTLQRLFRRYVGVSPKWVLQRYRLHEAAERIAEGRDRDWAATALELGYADQAHFIRDFKALIGASPAQYAG